MQHMTVKDFMDKVKELDSTLKRLTQSENDPSEARETAIRSFWLKPLHSLIRDNVDFVKSNMAEIRKQEKRLHARFICPLFTAYIQSLTFKKFPYTVREEDYKKLLRSINSSESAEDIQAIADKFKHDHIDWKHNYTFKKIFRPHHPLHYMLAELEVTEVNSDRVIAGLNPYITFPQNKTTKDLQFALAMAAGLPVQKLMSISIAIPKPEWNIDYVTDSQEKGTLQLLHDPDKWHRAFEFLRACETTKAQASQAFSDVPLFMIGLPLPYKEIPDLHAALCKHFHKTEEDSTSFKVSGSNNLQDLIDQYNSSTTQELQKEMASLPEIASVMEKVIAEPGFKVTVSSIRELPGTASPRITRPVAEKIDAALERIYGPLERRPSRREKYAPEDRKKASPGAKKPKTGDRIKKTPGQAKSKGGAKK